MANTRDFNVQAIFGANGVTTIPDPPVAGTTYRDTAITDADIQNGWPYQEIVNSPDFNQIMFEYSSVLNDVDKSGIVGWTNAIDYAAGAWARGSNGSTYVAAAASGPATTVADPTDNANRPSFWRSLEEIIQAEAGGGGALLAINNLSDLNNTATARTNLGLGALATLGTVGTTQIDDDAVTLAKLAGGTANRIYATDGSGNPELAIRPIALLQAIGGITSMPNSSTNTPNAWQDITTFNFTPASSSSQLDLLAVIEGQFSNSGATGNLVALDGLWRIAYNTGGSDIEWPGASTRVRIEQAGASSTRSGVPNIALTGRLASPGTSQFTVKVQVRFDSGDSGTTSVGTRGGSVAIKEFG